MFEKATALATMIFAGTVVQRDSGTIIVRADSVLRSARSVGNFARYPVVVLTSDSTTPSSRRAVFFAYGASLSDTIRVREVLRVSIESSEDLALVRARLARADSVNEDRGLVAKADSADALVVGRIVSATPLIVAGDALRNRSEHTPAWVTATVSVTGAFISRDTALVNRTVRVLVAARASRTSGDSALVVGDRRILFLRRAGKLAPYNRPGVDTSGTYFVFLPNSVRPYGDSARLVRLLR